MNLHEARSLNRAAHRRCAGNFGSSGISDAAGPIAGFLFLSVYYAGCYVPFFCAYALGRCGLACMTAVVVISFCISAVWYLAQHLMLIPQQDDSPYMQGSLVMLHAVLALTFGLIWFWFEGSGMDTGSPACDAWWLYWTDGKWSTVFILLGLGLARALLAMATGKTLSWMDS